MTRRIHPDDLPRIFATVRYAGELGEAHGQLLWRLSRDWSRGLNAGSLDGNVTSSDVSDPTGRTALHGSTTIDQMHAEVAATIARLETDAAKIRDWITNMVTSERPANPGEDFCRNHLRIDVYEPRYRGDLCRPCYEITRDARFKGAPPSPALMAHWQRHARTSDDTVVELMEAEQDHRRKRRTVDTNITQARRSA